MVKMIKGGSQLFKEQMEVGILGNLEDDIKEQFITSGTNLTSSDCFGFTIDGWRWHSADMMIDEPLGLRRTQSEPELE